MSEFTLYYFQLHGRGCAARALLTHSGTQFEDKQISFADWGALKPTMPGGQLPCLELADGTKMG